MTLINNRKNVFLFLALFLLVLGSNLFINLLPSLQPLPTSVLVGSFLDFLITIPLLFYFFILRKKYSLKYLIPVIVFSYFFATWIMADLSSFKWIVSIAVITVIFLELYFLILLLSKVPLFIISWKKIRLVEPYFLRTLTWSFQQVLGNHKLSNMLSFDMSMIYYCFFTWRKKANYDNVRFFSYHTKTSYIAIIIMLLHAAVIEAVGFHFLLHY